jgi:hypothetical protein
MFYSYIRICKTCGNPAPWAYGAVSGYLIIYPPSELIRHRVYRKFIKYICSKKMLTVPISRRNRHEKIWPVIKDNK